MLPAGRDLLFGWEAEISVKVVELQTQIQWHEGVGPSFTTVALYHDLPGSQHCRTGFAEQTSLIDSEDHPIVWASS